MPSIKFLSIWLLWISSCSAKSYYKNLAISDVIFTHDEIADQYVFCGSVKIYRISDKVVTDVIYVLYKDFPLGSIHFRRQAQSTLFHLKSTTKLNILDLKLITFSVGTDEDMNYAVKCQYRACSRSTKKLLEINPMAIKIYHDYRKFVYPNTWMSLQNSIPIGNISDIRKACQSLDPSGENQSNNISFPYAPSKFSGQLYVQEIDAGKYIEISKIMLRMKQEGSLTAFYFGVVKENEEIVYTKYKASEVIIEIDKGTFARFFYIKSRILLNIVEVKLYAADSFNLLQVEQIDPIKLVRIFYYDRNFFIINTKIQKEKLAGLFYIRVQVSHEKKFLMKTLIIDPAYFPQSRSHLNYLRELSNDRKLAKFLGIFDFDIAHRESVSKIVTKNLNSADYIKLFSEEIDKDLVNETNTQLDEACLFPINKNQLSDISAFDDYNFYCQHLDTTKSYTKSTKYLKNDQSSGKNCFKYELNAQYGAKIHSIFIHSQLEGSAPVVITEKITKKIVTIKSIGLFNIMGSMVEYSVRQKGMKLPDKSHTTMCANGQFLRYLANFRGDGDKGLMIWQKLSNDPCILKLQLKEFRWGSSSNKRWSPFTVSKNVYDYPGYDGDPKTAFKRHYLFRYQHGNIFSTFTLRSFGSVKVTNISHKIVTMNQIILFWEYPYNEKDTYGFEIEEITRGVTQWLEFPNLRYFRFLMQDCKYDDELIFRIRPFNFDYYNVVYGNWSNTHKVSNFNIKPHGIFYIFMKWMVISILLVILSVYYCLSMLQFP